MRRAVLKRLALAAAALLLFGVLALFNALFPFRTLLPAAQLPAREEGELRLHFLSVGQGDCTVVEFPSGDCLVVDAGNGSFEHDNVIFRYLKGIGSERLSVLVTHPDTDHSGGAAFLIGCFGAEALYLTQTEGSEEIVAEAERVGADVRMLKRYDVIADESGAYLVCISPHAAEAEESSDGNDRSAVLYLSYGGVNVLLGADITGVRERSLVREAALSEDIFDSGGYAVRLSETDILRVSHHGSAASSTEEWLELLGAETAIVSCGAGNSYGHPAGEALGRLAAHTEHIYRTDELGHILVRVRGGNYTVTTSKGVRS